MKKWGMGLVALGLFQGSAWAFFDCPTYLQVDYQHPAYGANNVAGVAFVGPSIGVPTSATAIAHHYFSGMTHTNGINRRMMAALTTDHLHCLVNDSATQGKKSLPVGFLFAFGGGGLTPTLVPVGQPTVLKFNTGFSSTGTPRMSSVNITDGAVIVKGGVGFMNGVTLRAYGSSGSQTQIFASGVDGAPFSRVSKGSPQFSGGFRVVDTNVPFLQNPPHAYYAYYACPKSFPVVVSSASWQSITKTASLTKAELVNNSALACWYTVDTSDNSLRVVRARSAQAPVQSVLNYVSTLNGTSKVGVNRARFVQAGDNTTARP